MTESASSALPPEVLRTVEGICDAFASAWKEGRRPAIEDYLGTIGEPVRPVLLGKLLRIELEWRCRLGEEPTAEEYQARFAACADTIDDWLTRVRQAAETLTAPTAPERREPVNPATLNHLPAPTPCPAPAPAAGSPPGLVGEYELLGKLGAGGMGEVYKARHRRLDKLVALKLLHPDGQHSADSVARFLREMKAVGALDHPNLVEAHDAGEQAGVVYLAMKLIDGIDLDRAVRERGTLPVAEACDLARQTALGLQYLRERGLVHRDLKPSNLMRTPDGTVKILDLGLARWRAEQTPGDDLTGSGQVVGTPDFLAPEQARCEAVDIRADLYGLGATLFFLLTGRAPFADHRGVFAKLQAHDDEAPPDVRSLRPEVPAGLAALVARLLAKKPEDRPQTPAEVAASLAEFARSVTPEGPVSVPPSTPPARTMGRRSWRLAVACVGVLALGLVVAVVWRNHNAPGRLAVLRLDVKHSENVAGRNDLARGVLGKTSFAARLDDSVTVEARLSRPAYAYVISFRPDGVEELCFPESEDAPPPLTDRPRYPLESRGVNYGLNEGAGLQVFAVVASSRPLPAYKAWRSRSGPAPWKKLAAPPGVVWWDNGEEVMPLTSDDPDGNRAKGQRVAGKTPVAELTDWLRRAPEVEAVGAVGFGVLPKKAR